MSRTACSSAPTGCSVGACGRSPPGFAACSPPARGSPPRRPTPEIRARPPVVEAAATPYPGPDGVFRIVAFGGSQGARVMADVVPPAIELVPMAVRARLLVTQQAREEDIARVRAAYARLGVAAEVE